MTKAGKLELILRLLEGPITDDEGNIIGYKPFITKEEALKLLSTEE